ncbi:hypothetical protein [Spirosoma sp.]|uniref:hypothetical protein n=1 Tax=Spirosoma sp. TaxID=1899569 RepID=UPI0026305AF0|nr:hypothetical protein [Spirosoma sp.]MCX6216570.1 hypothetical protein [Spirosoma sp.]
MSVTNQFWAYLKPKALSVEGVVYSMLSDGNRWERVLGDSRSENVYPGFFCLRPKYKIVNNGADQVLGWFDVTFFVFCHCKRPGDYAEEDAAFDKAEEIAADLYKLLEGDDGKQILFDEDKALSMEPVSWLISDAVYGYEVKLRFALPVNPIL